MDVKQHQKSYDRLRTDRQCARPVLTDQLSKGDVILAVVLQPIVARNFQQHRYRRADNARGDIGSAQPCRNGWSVKRERNRYEEAGETRQDHRKSDVSNIEAVIADIVGLADLGKARVDDDLYEPDLAKHPENQHGPEEEKSSGDAIPGPRNSAIKIVS
jgi:hypothetical protein